MQLQLNRKKIIQYILFLAIAFLFLWLASRGIPLDKMMHYIRGISLWPLLLVFIGGIGSHYLRALRWKMLIKPLGYNVSVTNTFLSIMIGYLVNLVTPRMGEVARCGVLSVYEKVPADKLAGTMIAERAFDLITLLGVFFITYFVEYDTVNAFVQENLFQPLSQRLSKTGLYLALTILIVIIGTLYTLRKKLFSTENKLLVIIKNILEGLSTIRKVESPFIFLGYTAGIWLLYLFMTTLGFWAFEDLRNLSFGEGLGVLSFGTIGFVVPAPGGMGSFQYFVSLTLQEMYHIEEALALAYANVSWLAQTLVLITGGFFSLIMLPIVNRKKSKEPL